MTDATHTPGPWAVSQPSGNYIAAPTGGIAALTYGATKADAHLIAAAPDLLAAMQRIVECAGEGDLKRLAVTVAWLGGNALDKAKGN